jgi:predicted RNase H-like nuclease
VQASTRPVERLSAIGVDGCRAGWIAACALGSPTNPQSTTLRLFQDIRELLDWHDKLQGGAVVAIDVPMGLPPTVGLRECDKQARARLGKRWMCVFEPPDRELLGHDFEGARAIVYARRAADPLATFHVLTQQSVHILNKIAEVDDVLCEDPARQDWLVEVHPEVCFQELAKEDLPRKKSSAGRSCRVELLRPRFPDFEEQIADVPWRRREVAYDDLLDAYVALWSAQRYARGPGNYISLGDGHRDDCGLVKRMVV